jgi:hypothetical protein
MRFATSLASICSAVIAVGCGHPSAAPTKVAARDAARPSLDASMPVVGDAGPPAPPGSMVLFGQGGDGRFEPVFCCEAGACRLEECASMVPDELEVESESGRVSALRRGTTVDCDGSEHRPAFVTNHPQHNLMEAALWPIESPPRIWWRGPRLHDATLTETDLRELGALGVAHPGSAEETAESLDLDGDGADDVLLTADWASGGVFVRLSSTGMRLVRLTPGEEKVNPFVIGAIDLDGDGQREILEMLGNWDGTTHLVVLDLAGNEWLRTRFICKTPVSRLD